jgi:hypothetical protein
MTITRLITWMAGVSAIAVQALPPFERMRLANECKRLLRAAEPPVPPPRAPTDTVPKRPRSVGILADLAAGERAL